VFIDDLRDYQIFEEMHMPAILVLRRDTGCFCRNILIERLIAPGLLNPVSCLGSQHFGSGINKPGLDMQPMSQLFFRKDTQHGSVCNQHFRLPGIQICDRL
jgi:hypothetical protein